MKISKVYVVTPAFNSEQTIDRTINSVISQSGRFEVHYHIQDGGSKDGTVEIIKKWKRLLESKSIPIYCHNLKLTYASEKDSGMYDAIEKGIFFHEGAADDWVGWINSDDILLPGAFALLAEIDEQLPSRGINWVTGASSVDWDDLPVAWGDRPVNREIISAGLCDGNNWSFIQQEGTFFRKKLWDAIDIKNNFSNYKYAGDWNLWRVMAKDNEIYQTPWPIGNFSRRAGQISQAKKDEYLNEINKTIPPDIRAKRLLEISSRTGPRWMIESRFRDKSLHAVQYTLNSQLKVQRDKVILQLMNPQGSGDTGQIISQRGFIGYDSDWQYPAKTEKHAFENLRSSGAAFPHDSIYFVFPWATLIDLLQVNGNRLWELQAKLDFFVPELKKHKRVITVCQHIWFKKYLYIFEAAGVTDVFASHATPDDYKYNHSRSVKFYPFQLYPVQKIERIKPVEQRKYLYSFVGAKSGDGYLSKARDWIFTHLKNKDDVFIRIRDGWHYDKIVYNKQIKNINLTPEESAAMSHHEEEYLNVLSDSVFALCPSGTGPNSIRLWEAIESGVIPVVISDRYLSPCRSDLWAEGVVTIAENELEVARIDEVLRSIFADEARMAKILSHLKMIRAEYGLDAFSTPVKSLMLSAFSSDIGFGIRSPSSGESTSFAMLLDLYNKKKRSGDECFALGSYLQARQRFLNRLNRS